MLNSTKIGSTESMVTNVVEPALTNVPISTASMLNVPEYGA